MAVCRLRVVQGGSTTRARAPKGRNTEKRWCFCLFCPGCPGPLLRYPVAILLVRPWIPTYVVIGFLSKVARAPVVTSTLFAQTQNTTSAKPPINLGERTMALARWVSQMGVGTTNTVASDAHNENIAPRDCNVLRNGSVRLALVNLWESTHP